MSILRMRLPDVGEGVAEAELVSWLVAVGDEVTPDSVLAEVLTDKATIEIASPTFGVVTALHGEPGDVLAVGGDLVEIETGDAATESDAATDHAVTEPDAASAGQPLPHAANGASPAWAPQGDATNTSSSDDSPDCLTGQGIGSARPPAAPAVRARARMLGVDLGSVRGSGPDGRVTHADLDRLLTRGRPTHAASTSDASARRSGEATTETVRGVRRRIAERLSTTWSEVPHITYVDAVDVTELERLRAELNASSDADARLTTLAFVARATAMASAEQPRLNAHYLHDDRSITTFTSVHVGIATQTGAGLLVPVVRRVETRDIWDLATEIARVTAAARDGSATREELSGSTITITSLGALGGLVTTPLLNAPEVAIVGVNKIETRPVWEDGAFRPRRMMNLSSSFDHRIVDGWDAATFVQRIRSLLETPALLFVGHL